LLLCGKEKNRTAFNDGKHLDLMEKLLMFLKSCWKSAPSSLKNNKIFSERGNAAETDCIFWRGGKNY